MIEIRHLYYSAGNRLILEDINLTLHDNEFAAIIGPNGAGKSTLLKIILGQLPYKQGSITIDGAEHSEWLSNNLIGYLPQYENFDRDFPATVMDIVLMGLAGLKGMFRRFSNDDKRKAENMLNKLHIGHLNNKRIGLLSGGELQRVFIARALVGGSRYLFLDEPEAGVDKSQIEAFYRLLKEINMNDTTILLVSHDIGMMTQHSKYIICLNKKLHCHEQSELINANMIKETYGDVMQLINKEY